MTIYRGVEIYLTKESTPTDKRRVLLADDVLPLFQEQDWNTKLFEGKVNTFRLPRGKEPGCGYVLLNRADVLALQSSTFDINLTFRSVGTDGDSTVHLQRLGITQAEAITGHIGSLVTNTIYLVELSDARYVAHHAPLNASFNMMTPTRTLADIYEESKNGGALWTWTTLIQHIWDQLPSIMGFLDTSLFDPPNTTPYNYSFQGVRAWDALHTVLADINHTLTRIASGLFFLVPEYAADTTTEATLSTATKAVVDPSLNIINVCEAPAEVTVYFPNLDDAFQTSTDQWDHHPRNYWTTRTVYPVTVSTAAYLPEGFTAVPGTKGVLHDPLPAEYNELGVPQNAAALTSRAQTVVEQYVKNLTIYPLHNAYEGWLHVFPFSALTEVAWYDKGAGAFTEVHFSSRRGKGNESVAKEHHLESTGSADVARRHPEYEGLVLVDLAGILQANGRVLARVQFGTNGGSSITWTDTNLPHEIYVYEAHGQTYDSGTRLWVKFQQQTRRWVVIPMGEGGQAAPPLIRFKLTTALPLGGKSTAIEVGTSPPYTEIGTEFLIKDPWSNPGSWRFDPAVTPTLTGYMGWCLLPDDPELSGLGEPYYEIVWMEQIASFIEFTSTEPMVAGNVTATLDDYYGNAGMDKDPLFTDLATLTGEIEVYDAKGNYPYVQPGSKGKAAYNNREHRYEIIECDQMQIFALATAFGAFTAQDAVVDIADFEGITFAPYGTEPLSVPSTAVNIFNLSAEDTEPLLLEFYPVLGVWFIVQAPPKDSASYFGKLDANLAHNATGAMSIWCEGQDTGLNIDVVNRTTQTLLTGVLMQATKGVGCVEYLVEPYELDPCP